MIPRVARTMGDPAGVGPELCVKLIADDVGRAGCVPIVFGDADVLQCVATRLSLGLIADVVELSEWSKVASRITQPTILNFKAVNAGDFKPGEVSAATGQASYDYFVRAIEAAKLGEIDAIATGPINKEALNAAGLNYPGHTEILADHTNTARFCMMLTSDEVTCSFVTTHVGYADVPALLTQDRIGEVFDLTREAMRRIRGRDPKLVVCALNPHAGEGGLFGDREEERIIIPAVEAARKKGMSIEGPLPPDTAFLPWRRKETDCFVCMYHDQGHIPLKALAFDVAVNITLGLPIIRTSVDHGTAFDIAWTGQASTSSFREAIKLASRLAVQPSA